LHYKNTIWLLLSLRFASSTIAQEVETSVVSETDQKPLRIYENLGGDFELTGPEGKEISSEIFRGKVMLIYFGYTYCPDVCPMVDSHLVQSTQNLHQGFHKSEAVFGLFRKPLRFRLPVRLCLRQKQGKTTAKQYFYGAKYSTLMYCQVMGKYIHEE
jgi:hypothetical protein